MYSRNFGETAGGRAAGLHVLSSGSITAAVTDYGAALVKLIVPDRKGEGTDVVLGYDNAAGYESGTASMGGIVGRYANRIGKGTFNLDGKAIQLSVNSGPNALHGGRDFYVHRFWDVMFPFTKVSSRNVAAAYAKESVNDGDPVLKTGSTAESLTFCLDSPDGDQGFPGNLHIEVTYTVTGSDLRIDYMAVSDADTPINLTNHSYFNLAGQADGSILDHVAVIRSDRYTETDGDLLPTGEILKVSGTPLDFREPKRIGEDIDADHVTVRTGGGYDHNYVLNGAGADGNGRFSFGTGAAGVIDAADIYCNKTGITMKVLTDMPGMQLYTANGLDEEGKDGIVYGKRSGLCLETQYWPDAVNHEDFPGGVLRAGDVFRSTTVYRFGTR